MDSFNAALRIRCFGLWVRRWVFNGHLRRAPGGLRLPWLRFVLGWLLVCTGISAATPETPPEPEDLDLRRDATVKAIEKVMPSVVNIIVRGSQGEGGGSGVVVDDEGYVLTNAHVVRGARQIFVKFNDEREPYPAELRELTRSKDIALLRIKAPAGTRFQAIKFAKEDDLLLGETVIALGYPFGLYGSVSRGILSSKNRRRPEDLPSGEYLDIPDWLQTDAAINPGKSGGPLINLRAEMIGLNVAILSPRLGAQGIGFAIPVKNVSVALADILSGESIQGYWFGAKLKASTLPLAVQTIHKTSPAEKAGLAPGDVVVSVNGVRPESIIEFNRLLLESGDHEDVRFTIQRDGRSRSMVMRMVKEEDFFNADLIRRRLGLTLKPVQGAFSVTSVERNGPAALSELEPGNFIATFDDQQPRDIVEFAKLVHWKEKGDSVALGILVQQGRGFFTRLGIATVRVKVR